MPEKGILWYYGCGSHTKKNNFTKAQYYICSNVTNAAMNSNCFITVYISNLWRDKFNLLDEGHKSFNQGLTPTIPFESISGFATAIFH